MNLRSTIYWLLSMLLLVLCLTYSQPSSDNKTAQPIALTSYLEVEPRFFYYSDNLFHANVVGQLRLDIKTENISEDISKYNALIIAGYQFNHDTEFSLNWLANDQNHQVMINQTQLSINHINFETEDANEISDLHLLITSTQELGLNNNFQDEVSFQSIHLGQFHNQNQLAANFSEWFDFNAVRISSINGYTNSTDLHYKNLILRLCSWLIVTVLMFWLCRIKGAHLVFSLFLAWVISSFFYVTNHIKQHNQISQAYKPGQHLINRLDQETHELAELIAARLKTPLSQFSSSDKLILIGTNTFFTLRLKHHLQQFNAGMYINLKEILEGPFGPQFNYIVTGEQLKYCRQPNRYDWLNNQVKFIHVDDDFCILRKE